MNAAETASDGAGGSTAARSSASRAGHGRKWPPPLLDNLIFCMRQALAGRTAEAVREIKRRVRKESNHAKERGVSEGGSQ